MVANNNSKSNGPNNFIGVYGSYGQGLSFGPGLGYQFSKHLSAEIDGSYLIGEWINNSNFENSAFQSTTIYKQLNYSNRSMMLRLIPSIKISAFPDDFTPYMKAGIVFGLLPSISGSSVEDDHYANTLPPNPTSSDTSFGKSYKYSGGTSIGGMAAIGVDIQCADWFYLYAEFVVIEQTWAPSQLVYSAWTKDGTDQLPNLTTSQKQTNYVNSYTTTSTINTSVPSEALKAYQPFGSWGINIGVRFYFGKAF